MTALHYATFNNRLAVVKVLLKHGADRTLKNKNGNTAASIAASRKLQDISDLLTRPNLFASLAVCSFSCF
eukprot:m.159224 g.159224  ORF g.159224 m.159224 type:complete len:70 (-) comp53008_c0_seq2:1013-1222(-)